MKKPNQYVVFTVDRHRFALRLAAVRRVVRMVELTAVPEAPAYIAGMINVQGELLPVVNTRRRFRLRERESSITDHLIIATTRGRAVVLIADAVIGVIEESDESITAAESVVPGVDLIDGMLKTRDGIVLLHDPDSLGLDWRPDAEVN